MFVPVCDGYNLHSTQFRVTSEEVCDKMKIAARPCRLPRAPVNRAANGGDQPCGFNLASNK